MSTMTPNTINAAAEAAHEVNRTYCLTIGDDSQKPWKDAPSWQRDSAISGVMAMINRPQMTPKDQHDAWLITKQQSGWVYGPVKDEAKKEHPCMVPYEKLPIEQKAKDIIFGAVVRAHLNR